MDRPRVVKIVIKELTDEEYRAATGNDKPDGPAIEVTLENADLIRQQLREFGMFPAARAAARIMKAGSEGMDGSEQYQRLFRRTAASVSEDGIEVSKEVEVTVDGKTLRAVIST